MLRRFRGTEYNIHVRRTGTRSLVADGRPIEGDTVPLYPGRASVDVEVTL